MKEFYHLAGDEFLETSGVARTKGDGCSVSRNKSVGPHICWFGFGFCFSSCPFSGLCALSEQKRVISDVVGLGQHTDQEIAYSSCSPGSRMCASLLSPTDLSDPAADITFFQPDMYFVVAFLQELNQASFPFLQRHEAKHGSFLVAGEKKLLLVVDLLITAV